MDVIDLKHIAEKWPTLPSGFAFELVSAIEGDSRGRIYIAHRGPHPVMCFDKAGTFLGEPGKKEIEASVAVNFYKTPVEAMGKRWWMHGLHVDRCDNLWITDCGRHIVMKFSSDWELLMTLGTPDFSGATETLLNAPTDVLVSPSEDIYVADGYGNARIVKYNAKGEFVRAWGTQGSGSGQFHTPHALAFDHGRLYVSDRQNNRIQVFDEDGNFLEAWPDYHSIDGVCLAPGNTLFLSGGLDHSIDLVDLSGQRLKQWITEPADAYPHWVWYDGEDRLYVANTNIASITRFAVVSDCAETSSR